MSSWTITPCRNHLDPNHGRFWAPFTSWDATTYPTKLSLILLGTTTVRWSSSGWDPCPAWSSMVWRTSEKCWPSRDTTSIPGQTSPDTICSSVETRRTVRIFLLSYLSFIFFISILTPRRFFLSWENFAKIKRCLFFLKIFQFVLPLFLTNTFFKSQQFHFNVDIDEEIFVTRKILLFL